MGTCSTLGGETSRKANGGVKQGTRMLSVRNGPEGPAGSRELWHGFLMVCFSALRWAGVAPLRTSGPSTSGSGAQREVSRGREACVPRVGFAPGLESRIDGLRFLRAGESGSSRVRG